MRAMAAFCALLIFASCAAATTAAGDDANKRFGAAEIAANRRAYAVYESCLEERERHRREFGDRRHASAVRVVRGASLKLECFDW